MSSHKRKVGRRSHKQSFRPVVEELESRLTPSSNATTNYFHVEQVKPMGGVGPGGGYSPLQILEAYGFYNSSGADNISFNGVAGNGAGQTIAIVDAYNDPNIASDLAAFDAEFGLAQVNVAGGPTFSVVNQNGQTTSLPTSNSSWAVEESLDVEWAHAIAPGANIVLVEASSASTSSLDTAVTTAANITGVSAVSMSWSGSESSGETSQDSIFTHTGVTYLAATGDSGSPSGYPAYSANVVAVGGTTLTVNGTTSFTYGGETGWSGSGGGASHYETEPSYQDAVQTTGHRTVPDVSFDADPDTGVSIYDSYQNPYGGPWTVVGGTSLATPSWAAIVSIINQGRVATGASELTGATQTLPALYSLPSSDFHDNLGGSNGASTSGLVNPAIYNEVTGLGSPTPSLISDMVAYGNTAPGPVATQLQVTAQPTTNVTAGAPFSVTVEALAANGSLASTFSGSITVSLVPNSSGATLGGTLTVQAVNGQATFSNLTLNEPGTGFTLQFASNNLTSATTSPFNVVVVGTRVVVTAQPPSSDAAGTLFGFTVAVEDSLGNIATGFSGNVTVALSGGAALNGTLTVPVTSGTAQFTGLSINTAGTGYTLVVTGTGLTSATTSSFSITAGAAAQLAIVTQPPSTVSTGAVFSVVVAAEDTYGNLVTGYTGPITVALANPGSATLGGTLTVAASGGKATFANLTVNTIGTYTLQATAASLTAATTNSFNVVAQAMQATHLVFTTEPPSTVQNGAAFIVRVSVENAADQVVTGYTGTVTIAIAGDPAGGSVTVSVVNGVATFDLELMGTGTLSLQATAAGLASATSNPITLTRR